MGLKERIFEKYLEANDITIKPDFGSGTIVYCFPDGAEMNLQTLLGTPEFAGFSDGIQRRANRFEPGPKGSPLPQQSEPNIIDMLYEAAQRDGVLGKIREALAVAGEDPRFGYGPQYQLGLSCTL